MISIYYCPFTIQAVYCLMHITFISQNNPFGLYLFYVIPNANVLNLIRSRAKIQTLVYLTPNPILGINMIYCLSSVERFFSSYTLLWFILYFVL